MLQIPDQLKRCSPNQLGAPNIGFLARIGAGGTKDQLDFPDARSCSSCSSLVQPSEDPPTVPLEAPPPADNVRAGPSAAASGQLFVADLGDPLPDPPPRSLLRRISPCAS